jgi:hypothetical protein
VSNARDDGGPAFPQPNQIHPGNNDPGSGPGMTLRDWFAGQALAGMIARIDYDKVPETHIAQWAYDQADAMLKARAQC